MRKLRLSLPHGIDGVQPVTAGFFIIIISMYSTNVTVSTKVLHAAKESLGELINGTAEVVGVFKALQQVAAETGLPLDSQIMSDCEQMFITINRLMYEQQSKLKHLQMMQVASEKASRGVANIKARHARKAGKAQESTLFNQPA